LVIEATNNPFEAILEGKLDLALVSDPVRNNKIRYTPLFEDDFIVIVPRGHRLAQKGFVEAEDIAGETILIYPPKEESTLLMKVLEPAGLRPKKVQEIMLTEAILEMVIGGLGIAGVAKWSAGPQLASGLLIGLPLKPPGLRWSWSVAQLRASRHPAYMQEFIRVLAVRPLACEPATPDLSPKNLSARTKHAPAAGPRVSRRSVGVARRKSAV